MESRSIDGRSSSISIFLKWTIFKYRFLELFSLRVSAKNTIAIFARINWCIDSVAKNAASVVYSSAAFVFSFLFQLSESIGSRTALCFADLSILLSRGWRNRSLFSEIASRQNLIGRIGFVDRCSRRKNLSASSCILQ